MKPIYFKINSISGWYIWSFKHKDILEGKGCGPFWTESECWDAIKKFGKP